MEWARLFETTEQFRALTVDGDVRDRYEWQQAFLRFLADKRDRMGTGEPLLSVSGRKSFERIVAAVHDVRELADSRDPLLAGPAPTDSIRLRAWLRLRQTRIGPLEQRLDRLLADLAAGQDELADEAWVVRLISTLTACERFFEQRGRLGESRASHGQLTGEQWDRILAAAEALDSLTVLTPEDPDTP